MMIFPKMPAKKKAQKAIKEPAPLVEIKPIKKAPEPLNFAEITPIKTKDIPVEPIAYAEIKPSRKIESPQEPISFAEIKSSKFREALNPITYAEIRPTRAKDAVGNISFAEINPSKPKEILEPVLFAEIKPSKPKEILEPVLFAEIKPSKPKEVIEPEIPQIKPSTTEKAPLILPMFSGINQQHTRKIHEPSAGKNFIITEQKLSSRDGTDVFSGTPFTTKINSIHSLGHANRGSLLIVEEGRNLWSGSISTPSSFLSVKGDVSGNSYNSTPWSDAFGNGLLMINGEQKLVYTAATESASATLTEVINKCVLNIEVIHSAGETLSTDGVLSVSATWPKASATPIDVTLPVGTILSAGVTVPFAITFPIRTVVPKATVWKGSTLSAAKTLTAAETLAANVALPFDWSTLVKGTVSAGGILPVDMVIPKESTIPSSSGVLPVKITTHTHPAVSVPPMEYATVWNGRVYTWAPNYEDGNLLRPCGTDDNFDISLDYWPPDIAINPSSDSTEPILSVNPVQSHLFILTNRGNYRLYGNTPDNWECHASGNVGAYSPSVVAVVKGMVIWLGLSDNAKTVYSYSGSGEVVIGGPIEGFLQDQNYSNVKAYSLGNQYWLMFSAAGITNAFVYDLDQKAWYIFEYPFEITAACMHGDYMAVPEIFFGLSDGKVAKVSSSAITGEDKQPTDGGVTFETECTIGPFKMPDNRKFKAKTFWLTAEPENLFKVKVYSRIDGGKEAECGEVEYDERVSGGWSVDTQRIKLEGAEGHNVTLRLNSTGRIKFLQSGSITVEPREVK